MPSIEPVLYSYWRSSCSYRVRIALALKGIPYKYEAVHLVKEGGKQFSEDYQKLNPMKELPSLAIDGAVLTQSTAIIEYLEETRPQPALLPSDPKARAQVRAVCSIISNDIQPLGNLRVLKHVASLCEDPSARDARKEDWARTYIGLGFSGLEKLLSGSEGTGAGTAGKYCVGDDVTMADCFLVPQVYNALRFKVDMAAYPTIARVHAALAEHPAFAAAHPSAQPDADA